MTRKEGEELTPNKFKTTESGVLRFDQEGTIQYSIIQRKDCKKHTTLINTEKTMYISYHTHS